MEARGPCLLAALLTCITSITSITSITFITVARYGFPVASLPQNAT